MFTMNNIRMFWMCAVLFVAFSTFVAGECPPGEFNPGPDCSFERICAIPSAHSYRRHYCDCWCGPGTIRDSVSNKCVKEDDCPRYKPFETIPL